MHSRRFSTALSLLLVALGAFSPGVAAQMEARHLVEDFVYLGSTELPIDNLRSLVPDAEGRVYVAGTGGDPRIHVLGADGSYVAAIGGIGDGPGEFYIPPPIRLRGDTIVSLDRRSLRIGLFHTDGVLLESKSLLPAHSSRARLMEPLATMADARVLLLEMFPSHVSDMPGGPHQEVRLQDASGGIGPILVELDGSTFWLTFWLPNDTGVAMAQPWSARDLIAVSPDGRRFAVVDHRAADGPSSRYRVRWFDDAGELAVSRWVDFRAIPVEREAGESFVDRMSEGLATQTGRPVGMVRRRLSDALIVPEYAPAVAEVTRNPSGGGVILSENGDTWLSSRAMGRPEGGSFWIGRGRLSRRSRDPAIWWWSTWGRSTRGAFARRSWGFP